MLPPPTVRERAAYWTVLSSSILLFVLAFVALLPGCCSQRDADGLAVIDPVRLLAMETAVLTRGEQSHGSGVVIGCEECSPANPGSNGEIDGYRILVLTAGHVTDGCGKLEGEVAHWHAPRNAAAGYQRIWDEQYDLSIVEYHAAAPRRFVSIRPQALRTGENVVMAGFPLWMPMQISVGIVGAPQDPDDPEWLRWVNMIADPGNSGSGVLDENGRLVGILVAGQAPSRSAIVPLDAGAQGWIQKVLHLTYPRWLLPER